MPPDCRVSAQILITERGVLSSCETFATKSCRSRSRRRNSVVSCRTTTAPRDLPPGPKGRRAAWTVRLRALEPGHDNSVRTGSEPAMASLTASMSGRCLTISQRRRPSGLRPTAKSSSSSALSLANWTRCSASRARTPSTMPPRMARNWSVSSSICAIWDARRSPMRLKALASTLISLESSIAAGATGSPWPVRSAKRTSSASGPEMACEIFQATRVAAANPKRQETATSA